MSLFLHDGLSNTLHKISFPPQSTEGHERLLLFGGERPPNKGDFPVQKATFGSFFSAGPPAENSSCWKLNGSNEVSRERFNQVLKSLTTHLIPIGGFNAVLQLLELRLQLRNSRWPSVRIALCHGEQALSGYPSTYSRLRISAESACMAMTWLAHLSRRRILVGGYPFTVSTRFGTSQNRFFIWTSISDQETSPGS